MKFTDLFAGLGGFNRALANHGHDCVLVSEVNPALIDLYELIHSIRPMSDVTKVTVEDIPEHDMLCAESHVSHFLEQKQSFGGKIQALEPCSPCIFDVSQVRERTIIAVKQGKGALVDFVRQGRRRSRDELDICGILEELANDAKYLQKNYFSPRCVAAFSRYLPKKHASAVLSNMGKRVWSELP